MFIYFIVILWFYVILICGYFSFLQGAVSSLGRSYEVVHCTRRAVFESSLPLLNDAKLIVTSVLSNFLCDACGSADPSQLVEAANAELSSHVRTLVSYLRAHRQARAVIVPPLPRLDPDWFNAYLPCFTTFLLGEISRHSDLPIQALAPFVALPRSFESDGVHLKSDAGEMFVRYVLNGVDQVFPSELPPSPPVSGLTLSHSVGPSFSHPTQLPWYVFLEMVKFLFTTDKINFDQKFITVIFSSTVSPSVPTNYNCLNHSLMNLSFCFYLFRSPSGPDPAVQSVALAPVPVASLAHAVSSLTALTSNLKAEVTTRRAQDNLVFARLKEDQDFSYNKNREDRFTVTGLKVSSPPPKDALERKEFFRTLLAGLILEACPELTPQPKILDVFVNMRYGRGTPFIEARLDTVSAASTFRVAAAKLAKVDGSSFSGLFVANSVTLTTRVRIEILRAIAKRLTTENEEAFVQGFSSRPMLHYQTRDHVPHPTAGTNRSYSFVEAVGRWGAQLTTVELLPAYRRARPAFIGSLEQYFVVLKESEPIDPACGFDQLFASGSNSYPLGAANVRGSGYGSRPSYRSFRSRGSARGSFGRGQSRSGPESSSSQAVNRRKRSASNDVEFAPSKKKETESESNDEALIDAGLNANN